MKKSNNAKESYSFYLQRKSKIFFKPTCTIKNKLVDILKRMLGQYLLQIGIHIGDAQKSLPIDRAWLVTRIFLVFEKHKRILATPCNNNFQSFETLRQVFQETYGCVEQWYAHTESDLEVAWAEMLLERSQQHMQNMQKVIKKYVQTYTSNIRTNLKNKSNLHDVILNKIHMFN